MITYDVNEMPEWAQHVASIVDDMEDDLFGVNFRIIEHDGVPFGKFNVGRRTDMRDVYGITKEMYNSLVKFGTLYTNLTTWLQAISDCAYREIMKEELK